MLNIRIIVVPLLAALVAGSVTGCSSRRGSRAGAGTDFDMDLIDRSHVGGTELAGRPGAFSEYGAGTFEPVYFEYDSAQVTPSERMKLETVADELQRSATVGVIVEGHCDERGSREYNISLGERRALAARAYLIGLGIDGSRIQSSSKGEEEPAVMGHDDSSWSQNRRAEFILFE